MTLQQPELTVRVVACRRGRWNWEVVAADGEVAVVGAASAPASAYDQADLFRRRLSQALRRSRD